MDVFTTATATHRTLLMWKAGEYCAHHYIRSDYDDGEDGRCSSDWAMNDLCNHGGYRDGCNGDCLRRWHALRVYIHSYELCGTCRMKVIDGERCVCDDDYARTTGEYFAIAGLLMGRHQ